MSIEAGKVAPPLLMMEPDAVQVFPVCRGQSKNLQSLPSGRPRLVLGSRGLPLASVTSTGWKSLSSRTKHVRHAEKNPWMVVPDASIFVTVSVTPLLRVQVSPTEKVGGSAD